MQTFKIPCDWINLYNSPPSDQLVHAVFNMMFGALWTRNKYEKINDKEFKIYKNKTDNVFIYVTFDRDFIYIKGNF